MERRIVERLSTTPTLAMGVNTPAAAAAIVRLTYPGRQSTFYGVCNASIRIRRVWLCGISYQTGFAASPQANSRRTCTWGCSPNEVSNESPDICTQEPVSGGTTLSRNPW